MVGVKPLPGWTDIMVMLVLRERGCSIRQNRISSKSEFITSVLEILNDFYCQPSSIRPPTTRFRWFLFLLMEPHFPQTKLSWQVGGGGVV